MSAAQMMVVSEVRMALYTLLARLSAVMGQVHETSFNTFALQYMAGGDLGSALDQDIMDNGPGVNRRLGWYARGRTVLLCVARGLAHLHSKRVHGKHASNSPAVLLGVCDSSV